MHCTGYGNDTSILGVPDIPIWLLRHDGKFLCKNYLSGLQACQNPACMDEAAESSRWLEIYCVSALSRAGYLTRAEPLSSTLDRAFWDPVSGQHHGQRAVFGHLSRISRGKLV